MKNIEILHQLKELETERIRLTAVRELIQDQCTPGKPISKALIHEIKLKEIKKDLQFALKSPYSKYYEYQPLVDYVDDRLSLIVSQMSTYAKDLNI